MRQLAGLRELHPLGGMRALFGIIARAERLGRPFELVELDGGILVGLGEPHDAEPNEPGPRFHVLRFGEGLRGPGRVYPVVIAADWSRIAVVAYESTPGAFASEPATKAPLEELGYERTPLLGEVVDDDLSEVRRRLDAAMALLREGSLQKLVVAGRGTWVTRERFSIASAASRLKRDHPRAHLYAGPTWVGVSPELLVKTSGSWARLEPLAGTARRGAQARLLASTKDRSEHELMVAQLLEDLAQVTKEVKRPNAPLLFDAGPFVHLATPIAATVLPGLGVGELLEAIVPTAAVAGVPRQTAAELLEQWEPWRGYYAGAVGVTDPSGDGEFYLAIRGVFRAGADRVWVAGGAGVVASSTPESELAEIVAKINAIAGSLGAQPLHA
jgi:isochorismate synthase